MGEYNPQELEKNILEFWKQNNIFQKVMEKNSDNDERFSFFDGPMTANNAMGVHHAWGRTYKDLFLRYKGMKGYHTRRQNGFDCQGLWVEVEVEKQLDFRSKKDIEKYGIKDFVEKCKERVYNMADKIKEDSIRLGMWMDWDNSYFTMSDRNNEHNWHFLKYCYDQGWIYKGRDVVPWCPRCSTAISNHEIATEGYKEVTDKAIFMKFPIKGRKNEYFLVWTTTPWTVLADVALAVDPNLTYVKAEESGEIYILSEKCLDELKGDYEILEKFRGEELLGMNYIMPYKDLEPQKGVEHKVVEWGEVGAEEGTGIVHIAPGCGPEDYQLGKEKDLKAISPLDEYGKYKEGYGWLTGLYANNANSNVIEELQNKGFMYKVEDYTHSYPHCWRCDTPLVFRLVDEWFIDVDEIRPKLIEETKKVNWNPPHGEDRMLDWLNNMDDWMISKKRYWGLPLPFWKCKNGHMEVIGSMEELKEKAIKGIDQLEELHKPWIDNVTLKCPECGEDMERVKDVGTPWLDAGIMSFSTLNYLHNKGYWEKWFPADFITECGPGQYKNWFYAMLFMSTVLEGQAPYKNVLAHELVFDENGEEMHKSKGNDIKAQEALENMGADVMRWIYSNQNPNITLNFGYSLANEMWRKLNIFYNLVKYLETYSEANNFVPSQPEPEQDLNKWILSKVESLKKGVTKEIDNYNPHLAAQKLQEFFLNDLSRFYGQSIRKHIKPYRDSKEKEEILNTFYYVNFETVKLLAPFIPFVTESLYQDFFKDHEDPESVHLCEWPKWEEEMINKNLEERMEIIQRVVEAGNSARQQENIGLRYPIKKVVIGGEEEV
ncbi:MAG: isoleucine--tRNA ligase [Candidatus Aenigmatarchaeota archaeon]